MEIHPRLCPDGRAWRAYVGCRTTAKRHARGRGIEVFDVSSDGQWTHLHTVVAGDNPSYLLSDAARRALYCVHGDGDCVSSFRIEEDDGLRLLGTRCSEGLNPVHLALATSRRWLLIANYASGDIVSMPVESDGALGPAAHRLALPDRPGPHKTQQRGAHPHQLVFDPSGQWLLIPDKGGDAVHTVALDETSGRQHLASTCVLAPMSGPRHLAFSADGKFAWTVLELSSQVLAASFDRAHGRLLPIQRTPSVPDSFVGSNTAAGIALSNDGRWLYVSNRGHGSVVRYAIDTERGTLQSPTWIDVQGKVPRFIASMPDRDAVLIANEDADSIVGIDTASSSVSPLASTGSPVCIVFSSIAKGSP